MKSLVALSAVFLSLNASAHITKPLPMNDPGVGLPAGAIRQLQKSVLKLRTKPNERLGYCSSFPVTPDGYILTALHCLRDCLLELNAAERAANDYLDLTELFVVREPGQVNAACAAFAIPGLRLTGGVKVVATGPAITLYGTTFHDGNNGFLRQLQARGWDAKANDFALLKVESQAPLDCLRLSTQHPSAGQDVWAVGFPGDTDEVLSAAHGHVFARAEDSQTYAGQKTEADRAKVRTQFGAANLIFSNTASAYGQSGGPIINSNGQVVGVVSGFAFPVGNEDVHELVGSDIANIFRSLPKETATLIAKKNAACRSQALTP